MSLIEKGYLMSKDHVVGKIENDIVLITDFKRCPIFFYNNNNIRKWLISRAVDNSRVNTRLLKKALFITKTDDESTVMYANAACITDNFWVKLEGSKLTWKKILSLLSITMLVLH